MITVNTKLFIIRRICTLCEGGGRIILRVFRQGHFGFANRGTKGLFISQVANGLIQMPRFPEWVWKDNKRKIAAKYFIPLF